MPLGARTNREQIDEPSPTMSGAATAEPTEDRGPITFQIGLATFGILALELALIRWTSGQVRVFAYFSNLVLIAAFLGMGLGVALGRRYGNLVRFTLPTLLILSIPLSFAESLGLVRLRFPDPSVFMWGTDVLNPGTLQFISSLSIFLSLFAVIVSVFVFAGTPVGYLFARIPTLRAYSADLLGSLLGIVAFTIVTFLNTSPPIWLALGALPFLWLSRSRGNLLAFAGIILLSWQSINGAVFSPYNRIDIVSSPDASAMLTVNRDFHQFMHDLSDQHLADPSLPETETTSLLRLRAIYDLPFQLNDARGSALVVGAGTGNDVMAALRNGYGEIVSVDIDGEIIELGKQMHPERVYDDPKVVPVVNDARAFFEQYDGELFDVVCYGLVDSHAMFSAMSTLRLDNYVYSQEGIAAAWRHISDRGHLTISFSIYGGVWIAERLYQTIARATGRDPIAVYHGMHYGATFIVARDPSRLALASLADYLDMTPALKTSSVRTVSDDWPFLYVRPGVFPLGYIIVLAAVLGIALVSTPLAFGRKALISDFDPVLFFMGAGFLLIETKGVTSVSLLFGSTWLVNAAIFASILTLVLIANLAVERFKFTRTSLWFVLLLLSVILLWAFDLSALNQYSLPLRGLIGGFITALPIGFAGIIVSVVLSQSRNASASLGSNLLGAVVGGCLEYLSMYLGLKAIVLLALALYLSAVAFRLAWHRKVQGESVSAAVQVA